MRKLRSRLRFDLGLEVILLGEFDTRPSIEYNNGTEILKVGAEMGKERDLKREWELEKARTAGKEYRVVCKIPVDLAERFAHVCKCNGTTKNAVLKRYIERYTYEGFDQ